MGKKAQGKEGRKRGEDEKEDLEEGEREKVPRKDKEAATSWSLGRGRGRETRLPAFRDSTLMGEARVVPRTPGSLGHILLRVQRL